MTGALIKRIFRHRPTRTAQCDDKGREWGDISTSQVISRVAHNHQKLGEKHGMNSPSEIPRETNLVNTLILDF